MVNATQQRAKVKAARLSVISNTFLVLGKLGVGIVSGSVSVISEAAHSALDLVAALIAYFAVNAASKPADEEHPYGHGKIENVSGTIEAGLIFLAAIYIIYEAVHKLQTGVTVEALGLGIGVMAISSVVNWIVSAHLMKVAKETESIALEADAWHLRTDVYTSLGVMVGLILIKLTGIMILDPIVAMGVALLIIKAAYDLTKDAFMDIIDAKLPDEDLQQIMLVLYQHKQHYIEYHRLRTRKAGGQRYVDLHLVVPKTITIAAAHQLCDDIETEIKQVLRNAQVLVHAEPCSVVSPEELAKCGCDQCSDC